MMKLFKRYVAPSQGRPEDGSLQVYGIHRQNNTTSKLERKKNRVTRLKQRVSRKTSRHPPKNKLSTQAYHLTMLTPPRPGSGVCSEAHEVLHNLECSHWRVLWDPVHRVVKWGHYDGVGVYMV